MPFFKPFTAQMASQQLQQRLAKAAAKRPDRPLQAHLSSPLLGLDVSFAANGPDLPYHSASVGKLFTASVAFGLAQAGMLNLDAPITTWLDEARLQGLFLAEPSAVTPRMLISHTSGVADYFEGITSDGVADSFIAQVLAQPNQLYQPWDLVEYTRQRQKPLFAPGAGFGYSDTGYILLGLVCEAATGKPLEQLLQEMIFGPVNMADSWLAFGQGGRLRPGQAVAPAWFNGVELSRANSLSCDWAGGGLFGTSADMTRFAHALNQGMLTGPDALEQMRACPNKFQPGLYYGAGGMEARFGDFFFLLGSLPRLKGHIGVLSTHLWYQPEKQLAIALNLADNTRMEESFRLLIDLLMIVGRLKTP